MVRPTVSVNRKSWAASKSINTTIKITSVCDGDARSVGGGRGWLAGDTDGLAGDRRRWAWSASQQQTLSGTGARLCTAHRGWLGVVSAASTGGVPVIQVGYQS